MDSPKDTLKSILKMSTAYKTTLDKEIQKYDDECYIAQDTENYQYEYGAEDKDSLHNDIIKASVANSLSIFDFF